MGFGGLVAQHNTADSQFHFNQLLADKSAEVSQMLAFLPGSFSISPPVSTPDRTVSSFVMEISGSVTYDDNSKGLFLVQWVNGALNLFPSATSEHWAAISVPGSAMVSFLDMAFEALAGGSGAFVNEEGALATATMLPVGALAVVDRGSGYVDGADLPFVGGTFSEAGAAIVTSLSTVAGQDESDYSPTEENGSFTPGSGYAGGDTITLTDGIKATVACLKKKNRKQ